MFWWLQRRSQLQILWSCALYPHVLQFARPLSCALNVPRPAVCVSPVLRLIYLKSCTLYVHHPALTTSLQTSVCYMNIARPLPAKKMLLLNIMQEENTFPVATQISSSKTLISGKEGCPKVSDFSDLHYVFLTKTTNHRERPWNSFHTKVDA